MGTVIGWVEPKSKPKAEKVEELTPAEKGEAKKAPAKAKKK